MSAELGAFALALALALSVVQAVLSTAARLRRSPVLAAAGEGAALGAFLGVAVAFLVLVHAFVVSDFSVANVAANSHTEKPLLYRIAGAWGSHEGSMLLWCLALAGYGAAMAGLGRNLPPGLKALAVACQGVLGTVFLAYTVFASNPLARLANPPIEGRSLNPLLQDPALAVHPPFLYAGYVGMSVVFSLAVAALIEGRVDAAWARWVRPWALAAWSALTVGITLGAFWAYYELGWGGWWFWDPVENASFMPWLVGTALIHSLAVTEKRGGFKMWTALLAILAFSLSLLGTFLVRSGVLSSVHAFATDPTRGVFILGFLVAVIGSSLVLFAWRGPKVGLGGGFDPVSREGMLLANNVLLVVATAAVLLGTLYPMLLDALNLGKISVGEPYFEAVFVPIIAPAIFLLGIGPVARWKHARLPELAVQLRWAAAVSVVVAIVAPLLLGSFSPMVGFGMLLAAWVLTTTFVALYERVKGWPVSAWAQRLRGQTGAWYGMLLAHAGVGVFIVGVTLVGGYETEQDLRMEVGSTASMGGYDFKLQGLSPVKGPNYDAFVARFLVTKDGREVATLTPEKRVYRASRMPMTEAAIARSLTRDLYVSLGESLDEGRTWIVRLYVKPFVNWIWGGCVLMALGAVVAVADRRYRLRRSAAIELPAGLMPR